MSVDAPSPDEAAAYAVVGSILGARVEHHDYGGRQAVVDALLHFADGRRGALEVTSFRSADRVSLDSALGKIRHRLPAVGGWTWYITIPPGVLAAGDGGFADDTLDDLRDSLADIFASPSICRRLRKLVSTKVSEHHMFIWITIGGLPFPLWDGIGRGDALPSAPPPVPAALDGLWLGTEFGRRVLVWRDDEAPQVLRRSYAGCG